MYEICLICKIWLEHMLQIVFTEYRYWSLEYRISENKGLSLNQLKFTINFVNDYGISNLIEICKMHRCTKDYLLKMRLLRLFEYKRGKWSLYIKMSKYNKFGQVELCSNVPPDRFLYDALGAYAFYLPESMFHMQFAFEMLKLFILW